MKTNKILVVRVLLFTASALVMGFIFYMSAQTAVESSETSESFIRSVIELFVKSFKNLSLKNQQLIIDDLEFFVRKSAHFSIYTLLGALVCGAILTYEKLNNIFRFIIPFGICLLYSISDEVHQLFVEGRSGEVRDVCIDTVGAVVGILIVLLIVNHHFKKQIKLKSI